MIDEEQQDVCAICLDTYLQVDSTKHRRSSLLLACGHEYHAGCLLLSCRKQPVHDWKCPLCRDKIVKKGVLDHRGGKRDSVYASHWECLHAFLNEATFSLHNELSKNVQETHKDSMHHAWTNSFLNTMFGYLPASFDTACVTICGRYRIQHLLDPTREPLSTLMCRHIFSMITSFIVFCCCTWFVKWFCAVSIGWVCPIGMHVLAKILPARKRLSLQQTKCFIKISDIANYVHALSYGLLAIILLLQANRILRRHLLHEWPSIATQVNIGLIALAILYAIMLFSIRLIFHIKFGFDEFMSMS